MARRIALFGQAAFARDVLVRLLDAGHEIVAVYAPPSSGKPDPLVDEAAKRGLRFSTRRSAAGCGDAEPSPSTALGAG
jgi:methionyl-tRNA formyltransferase